MPSDHYYVQIKDTSQTSHFDNGNYLSLGLGPELSLGLVS